MLRWQNTPSYTAECCLPKSQAGRSGRLLKSAYLERYGIPARMFNALRVSLEGKISSVQEQQKLGADSLQRRIARADRQVSDAAERGRGDQVHQKRRRLANLKSRLVALHGAGSGFASGPSGCGGSNMTWGPTATPAGMAQGLAGGPERRVLRAGQQG